MATNNKRIIRDEIDAAVRAGNYVLAGALERERNTKIDNEGLSYAKTNDYTPYLDRDYGEEILSGIKGGNLGAVSEAMKLRDEKTKVSGYTQYANDDISRKAQSFVDLNNTLNQPFSYEQGSAQVKTRQNELDKLAAGLRNYKEFSYNPETDPLYAALSAQYTKNGRRAMQDTIAEVSARTGGLASSYAATAGNQAYASYMSELGSKVPELSQLAYQMYNDEYNRKLSQASLAQNMYESELAKRQNDRSFAYGQYADNRNMAYNRLNDMAEGERYNTEWGHQLDREAEADALDERRWNYDTALEKAQTLAQYGIFDGYRELGWTDDEINDAKAFFKAQNALKASGGSGTKNNPVKPSSAYDDVVEELWGATDTKDVNDVLAMNVAAKKITQAEADEIRKVILGNSGYTGDDENVSGMSADNVSSTLLGEMIGAGIDIKNADDVTAYIDEYLENSNMSKEEKEELAVRILQAYGLY